VTGTGTAPPFVHRLAAALGRVLGHQRRRQRPASPPESKAMQPDDYQNKAIMPEAYAAKARRREH
jgi:hypothetical protein